MSTIKTPAEGPPDPPQSDPVLQMLGVGKHLWSQEPGDEYIRRERAAWDHDAGSAAPATAIIVSEADSSARDKGV